MKELDHAIDFANILASDAKNIDAMLDIVLLPYPQRDEIFRPKHLLQAMRHGVLNGGKRLRPFLLLQTAALFDANKNTALRVAAALEAVHCYSLIHDDLPSMDDDDLRRGKPTVHKAYDEATAILAGDALLTLAFDIIADEATELKADIKLKIITALARASGLGGMVGGQMLDLLAQTTKPNANGIIMMQAMKTGALLRFACEAGAYIGNAVEEDRQRLIEFGAALGVAFQIADDMLDITSNTDVLGKTAGKDLLADKATLVALHGIDWAKQQLDGLIIEAEKLLEPFGAKADILRQAAHFVANRTN